jgi:hypothetical protein
MIAKISERLPGAREFILSCWLNLNWQFPSFFVLNNTSEDKTIIFMCHQNYGINENWLSAFVYITYLCMHKIN